MDCEKTGGFAYIRVGMKREEDARAAAHERHRLGIAIVVPGLIGLLVWAMLGLEHFAGGDWYWLGVYPRTARGLVGVVLAPLQHSGLSHALSNTIPLLVLGVGLFYFYPHRALWVLLVGWLGTGLGVWLSARASYHLGASGLVYCLAAYLCISGIIRGQRALAAVSLVVILLYGSLVWGLLPSTPGVSWESHAWGTGLGLAMAALFHGGKSPEGQGIGSAEPYIYSGITHSGAREWRVRYRIRRGKGAKMGGKE